MTEVGPVADGQLLGMLSTSLPYSALGEYRRKGYVGRMVMTPAVAVSRFAPFVKLTKTEIAMLIAMSGPTRVFKRGRVIQREGDAHPSMFLLHEGWTASSIMLGRAEPQIIKMHVPGDVIGTPSIAYEHACDSVQAITDVTVSTIKMGDLGRLFERSPRLAAVLFLISQEERSNLMDRFAATRLDATGRVATLVLHLRDRLQRTDHSIRTTFVAPLTQIQISELTGLTSVHVNRTLLSMRKEGMLSWTKKVVELLDEPRLRWAAGAVSRTLVKQPDWLPAAN